VQGYAVVYDCPWYLELGPAAEMGAEMDRQSALTGKNLSIIPDPLTRKNLIIQA